MNRWEARELAAARGWPRVRVRNTAEDRVRNVEGTLLWARFIRGADEVELRAAIRQLMTIEPMEPPAPIKKKSKW